MEHENSFPPPPPPLNQKKPQGKINPIDFLIDNHPNKTNVKSVVKPPKNYEVVYVNDESKCSDK